MQSVKSFPSCALRLIAAATLAMAALQGLAKDPAVQRVDVFHWWVSGGERASIESIRDSLREQGVAWNEDSVAGSGTARYTDVLEKRVRNGRPPTAAQMIGYDIHAWAERGLLENLDSLAEREEWGDVVPIEIQNLSKFQGHWVATPFNTHATNWLWVNKALAKTLGVQAPPDSFLDLLTLLDQARALGVVPLAMGREAWEHTLLFESVAAGVLGASVYRQAFVDLDARALPQAQAMEVFARMRVLSTYLDPGYKHRKWDDATEMVRTGKALLQVQGSWVNGEFTARAMQPGRDYACWHFPDTQGVFLFNSDQYIFFRKPVAEQPAQQALASLLMSRTLQAKVNVRTGAAPARVDVPPEGFNTCGKQLLANLRASNMRRTLLGSIAMGNANPPAVKTAIYRIVTEHLQGSLSDSDAAIALRKALTPPALARSARPVPTR